MALDTEFEVRLHETLNYMRVPHEVGHVLCFSCGKHWKKYTEGMPPQCAECGLAYTREGGQWCQPDNVIQNGDKEGIVFVNGEVHDRKHQRNKDKYQIEQIKGFNYKVFVVNNEQIKHSSVSWLRMAAWTMYLAVGDDALYFKVYKGEKEYKKNGLYID